MKYLMILALTLVVSSCGGVSDTRYVQGPKGDPGASGLPGTNGLGCTESQVLPTSVINDPARYGGAVIECPNGSTLISNGAPGANGADGVNGTNGINGLNGSPGTSVSSVQFCAGSANAYPEVGFALGTAVYGVYWDGRNAWLSYLPPGAYSSTSSSVPCNFTINANGTVSH